MVEVYYFTDLESEARSKLSTSIKLISIYLSVLTASRFVEIAKSKKNIRLFGNKRVIHKVYKSHKMLDMDLTCSPLKFPNAVPLI